MRLDMRRAILAFWLLAAAPAPILAAQASDLARSYYHFSLAKTYEAERRFSEAISEFEKALALDPESSHLHFEFGRTLLQASEIRRGVQELEESIRLDPENFRPHLLLGQVRRRYAETGQGQMLDQALESFQRVLELEPDHPEALYYLGELFLLKGEPARAVENLERLNRVRPEFVQGAVLEARAQLAMGNAERAVELLERARELDPDTPGLSEFLGRVYEQQGQDQKALDALQEALESAPTLELRFRIGVLLGRVGRPAEAIEMLKAVAQEARDDSPIVLELGKLYSEVRNYSKAVESFQQVLQSEPDNTEANYYQAVALRAMGKRQEAIARVQHLLGLAEAQEESENSQEYRRRLQSFLAVLYQDDRQFDKAVALFRQLQEEEPDNFRWTLGLIYALKEQGALKEALSASRELLQAYPDNLDVQITNAQMLSESGRLSEAVQLLSGLMDQHPQEENYYLAASQLYSDHKQFQRAEELLRRGLETRTDSERLAFQLAAMLERQGKFELAEEGFRRILQANPNHAAVLNYLGYMLADRGSRLQEARDYIERAVRLDPHNGAYLDSLGWVYYQLNQLDLAETNLIQAAQINDSDPTILEHLGDLYLKLGDYAKARAYYLRSVRFAEDSGERVKVERKLASVDKLLARQNDN